MISAKDHGFNEGFVLDNGAVPPDSFTSIKTLDTGESIAVPNKVLDDEYVEYGKTMGESAIIPDDFNQFGKSFSTSRNILKASGLTKSPTPQDVHVGVDFKGDKVYANPELANSKDTSSGKALAQSTGIALGAMGAFDNYDETGKFINIGDKASDQEFHSTLDKFKANQDPKGFVNTLSALGGTGNKLGTGYTSYKLYENWGNMSPAQKAIGISGAGMQGFTFSDGKTIETKNVTPDVPGVPSMSVAESLKLVTQGVNTAPVARKWDQMSAIQETFYTPKKSSDVATTTNSLGLLGFGMEGTAVEVNESLQSQNDMQPAPHYGVGAATIPAGQGIPTGYTAVKNFNGRTIIAPQLNAQTSLVSVPDVSSQAASQVYNKWKSDGPVKQDKGVVGGNALVGGLTQMSSTNPYSLGAVTTYATLNNSGLDEVDDLSHVTHLSGVTMQRLVNGNVSKDIDKKGLEFATPGDFTEDNYNSTMKRMQGEYARNGISSKEVGYQLANQAYAEGRLNESQLVAAQKTLDMTFDKDGYVLAQKLNTGKNKGLEIASRRRG